MHSVTVMMSTYNGEKYLREQLESILNQTGVKVNLVVRDDGSVDTTQKILQEYAAEGKLKWYSGKNLRAAYSFLDLLKSVPKDEFYAFSDQDDVWDKKKLLAGIDKLKEYPEEAIILYTCSVRVVSSDLSEIDSLDSSVPVTTFMDGMIRNNSQGCTMVFGNALRNLLIKYNGKNLFMHDDLAVKVCLAVGGTIYRDSEKYINYRQHGNNVIGTQEPFMHSFKRRAKSLLNQSCERSKELQDIVETYSDLIPAENRDVMEKIAYYKSRRFGRIRILFDRNIASRDSKTTRHFKFGVLMGFF